MAILEMEKAGETFENLHFPVTPAKAGVQNILKLLDSGFRRNDDLANFRRNSKVSRNLSLFMRAM